MSINMLKCSFFNCKIKFDQCWKKDDNVVYTSAYCPTAFPTGVDLYIFDV